MLLLGTFDYAMDERGRIPLPPRFRDAFREGIVLSPGSPDRCILLHSSEEFARQARPITDVPRLHRAGRVLRRGSFHGVQEVSLDSQNRILIPGHLRDYANITSKVRVFGTGEWLELWAPEEYDAEMARVAQELADAQEAAGIYRLMAEASRHVPVMVDEVLEALDVRPGGRYVDCTLGGGGHAEAILERSQPGGTLMAIDADAGAIERATSRLAGFGESFRAVQGNFRDAGNIFRQLEFAPVNGVLMDLGLSSDQLESGSGFSFQRDTPLDMRFGDEGVTAAEIVNTYGERELADLIFQYGEEPASRRIARRIIEARPIETSAQLAKAVEQAVGRRARSKTHPATRTFQALRIAVNTELDALAAALPQAHGLLGFGARMVVLSYHSLEDRIVKEYFRRESRDCICPPGLPECRCGHKATLRLVTRGAVKASASEIAANPRARSARLRAAERIAAVAA